MLLLTEPWNTPLPLSSHPHVEDRQAGGQHIASRGHAALQPLLAELPARQTGGGAAGLESGRGQRREGGPRIGQAQLQVCNRRTLAVPSLRRTYTVRTRRAAGSACVVQPTPSQEVTPNWSRIVAQGSVPFQEESTASPFEKVALKACGATRRRAQGRGAAGTGAAGAGAAWAGAPRALAPPPPFSGSAYAQPCNLAQRAPCSHLQPLAVFPLRAGRGRRQQCSCQQGCE